MASAQAFNAQEEKLIEMLRDLPADKVSEVLDFIEFLHQKAQAAGFLEAAMKLSEGAFARVWDNPLDAEYDSL